MAPRRAGRNEPQPVPHNPVPEIPGQNQWGEIDVDSLNGKDLVFDIIDADVHYGQSIYPVWRGVADDGTPFDELTAMTPVPTDYAVTRKMTAAVSNRFVQPFKGGSAFLSYKVDDFAEDVQDSKRVYCYLGLRDHGGSVETLSVAQVRESHDRLILTDDLGTEGVAVLAPSYRAMQRGDAVELVMHKFNAAGAESQPFTQLHDVTEANIGEPLQWQIPKREFMPLAGGKVELQYHIRLVDNTDGFISSPVQGMLVERSLANIKVIRAGADKLPRPSVDGFTGSPLDPSMFPQGVTIRVPVYPGLEVGDYVLLHWRNPNRTDPEVQFVRMDASSLIGSETVLRIAAELLEAGTHQVFYQYAREGHALSSEVLKVEFDVPRNLLAPSIVQAEEDGPGQQKLNASAAILGAYVRVPAQVLLLPDERFEVHWDGYEQNGKQVTDSPTQAGGREFLIDPSVVAANMHPPGEAHSRRFSVFYVIVSEDGARSARSPAIDLRIQPLSFNSNISCQHAETNGDLKRSRLDSSRGALLKIDGRPLWPFAAQGQLLKIAIDSGATLRNSTPVTASELSNGLIQQWLSIDIYNRLQESKQYSVVATVSFDNGDSWFAFPPLRLTPRKSI